MSRAFALGASRVAPFAAIHLPALDPVTAAEIRRAIRGTVQAGGMLLGSVAAAAVVWVMLAGPGFVSGGASTLGDRHTGAGHGKAGQARMAAR